MLKKTALHMTCLMIAFSFATVSGQNLIRNSSFEDAIPYKSQSKFWTMTKKQFDQNMRFWTSPSGGTPDIILDRYRDKPQFIRTGLDLKPCLPRSGTSMVAIRSFGCQNLTPHCREYLQAKTNEVLKKGCTYHYEFYAQPAVTSIRINNLGIAFTEFGTNDMTNDQMLTSDNVQTNKEIIFSKIGRWVKIEGDYTMEQDHNFILIGNFFDDEHTKHRRIEGGMKTAYYMIDDVSLTFKSCPNNIDTSEHQRKSFTLDHILFDTDSATLNFSLIDIYNKIKNQPYEYIRIEGHTDSQGSDQYNLKLSLERANAVMHSLSQLGIPKSKMKAIGLGSSKPASNMAGKYNRRVVMIIE